jgi:UDPglucose 6-dehydrogenase
MKVGVIGAGYVGLVTGACLANTGNDVVCADKDEALVEQLQQAEVPIYEEGLEALIERNTRDERLHFTSETERAVDHADVIFITVGTPPGEDGSADLSNVEAVAETIGRHMEDHKIVVCKSTVPVGTCERVADIIDEQTDQPFDVASNPEFMKEGTAAEDFKSPSRVVVGCESEEATDTLAELYQPFMRRSNRLLRVDVRSAEMIKYASNAMLATKISFINEMANICEQVGADVEMVRQGMSLDERIGPHFIYPGVGYGGSCFPKDIKALARTARESGMDPRILDAVDDVNEHQKTRLYRAARKHFDSLEGLQLAVWGLSFKPRTDDIREAPSLLNIERFVDDGAEVRATDPEAIPNAREALESAGDAVTFSRADYEVLEGADAVFIFTEWEEFRNPDFERMRELMNRPVVFDGRNLYDPEKMRDRGFEYVCIGRP